MKTHRNTLKRNAAHDWSSYERPNPKPSNPCRGPAYGHVRAMVGRPLDWTNADFAAFWEVLPGKVMEAKRPAILKAMREAGLS